MYCLNSMIQAAYNNIASLKVRMPTFAVYTNLPKDNIPADFLQQTTAFLAKQLGKQEQVSCHFNLRFNFSNNEYRSVLSLLSISI